ncbi:trypsin-like peptidase domain-containing protein [Streptomyces sp. ISL-36]|uniref:trypsin-like peptidase domain-containing protein n=1 Tax=Streptomyces sp. ISL-36 TaxID=2819182 RepID=UPI002034FC13|nr:trypsin-like peptidase domain-containing protein [Streptomyces sp. ISL-36]
MGRGDLATLVRIWDPAGRPRGTGFVADDRGTVVTSHEAVDGLARLVLRAPDPHGPGERTCHVEAGAVTALPESGLALVRTQGLGTRPLPITARTEIEPGTYVRIAAHGWREARVLGPASVTYLATDRFHPIGHALELAIGTEGAEALRLGGQAAGGPVVDPATGAVIAVLGTALRGERHAAGYAVPLTSVGALDALLRRNAATVPCYGQDLNLAGVLELTATSTGSVGAPRAWTDPVERAGLAGEFSAFAASQARVLALVGAPGTGRTTALAAHCARRAGGPAPAPTVWLRGADLRAADASVADAVGRALDQAGRIVATSGTLGDVTTATAERSAALARAAGRPLLVILDGPEEMTPQLAHRLAAWTEGTEHWLGTHGVRLMLGCRPEYWEQASGLYSRSVLHRPAPPARPCPTTGPSAGTRAGEAGALSPRGAVLLGDLSEDEARVVRERYGLAATDLAAADARHPLALRLLAEVRAALPGHVPGRPRREEIFGAYVDLMCLRIAVRIAAGSRPLVRGTAVRRLAARVAGRVHEAARRCLGPGQGELDRESFEEIFPWRSGWASAVLTEGLVVPAGSGYRFGHEELADWIQGAHLDVDGALSALVHRLHETAPPRPARLPSDPDAPRATPAAGTGSAAWVSGSGEGPLSGEPGAAGGPWAGGFGSAGGPPSGEPDAAGGALSGGFGSVGGPWAGGPCSGEGPPAGGFGSAGGARPGELGSADEPLSGGNGSAAAHSSGGYGSAAAPSSGDSSAEVSVGGGALGSAVVSPGGPRGAFGGWSAGARVPAPRSPGYGAVASTVGSGPAVEAPRTLPVPRHRIGPVLQALLLMDREQGPAALAPRLRGLVEALTRLADAGLDATDGAWWGGRLLAESLLRVDDPRAHLAVLRHLADRLAAAEHGGPAPRPRTGAPAFAPFGPAFWEALRIGEDERMDLLRRVVPADAAPGTDPATPRYLDAVAARLVAEPRGVQPLLCRWFGDARPLAAAPHATVATAAQALLHTHRHLAVDDLCEALVATAHPLADGLLGALAEDEPSAVCRAVDRWAHDDGRPERRAAAAIYGRLVAGRVTTGADRALLRYAALALLARPDDAALHGPALGLLVRDPHTRSRHLPPP